MKAEIERQQMLMAQYTEFIRGQSEQVIAGIEEAHEGRYEELKQLVDEKTESMRQAESRERAESMTLNRQIRALKDELFVREKRIDQLESEVAWARERNGRLEEALHSATIEIRERADANAKLEFRAGDQQQALLDLERVRKTLTAQLFDLRQESGPREELLTSATAKLREAEREYEHALHAMSEKDKIIAQKSAAVLMLQQQNRELRASVAKKDQILQRTATQFVEHMVSLEHASAESLRRVVNNNPSENKSSGASKLSNLIVYSAEMRTSLMRLEELLKPSTASAIEAEKHLVINHFISPRNSFVTLYIFSQEVLSEEDAVEEERDRHMQLLTRTVSSLQETMELKEKVSNRHISGNIAENMDLINEVNALRKEVLFCKFHRKS